MANNVFKLKRSSVAGKVPNTSSIAIGELGLNLTDRILYSSDGTTIFEIGSNTTNQYISNTLTVGTSLYIVSNGNLGLSNSNPTNKISVNGTGYFTGNVTTSGTSFATHFDNVSDISLKTNIEPIKTPFTILEQLNPVSFNWKETGEKSFGLIAQEVEKVLPEIVHDRGDVKTVSYIQLISFLISAVNELNKKLENINKK